MIGGRTGRDGIGGATGSSKSHDVKSIETAGAEVQKETRLKKEKFNVYLEIKKLVKKWFVVMTLELVVFVLPLVN